MDDLLTKSIAAVVTQGVLGALLVLACTCIVLQARSLANLNKERIKDWKEIGELLRQNGIVMSQWVTTNTARSDAMDASVEAQRGASVLTQQMASDQREIQKGIQALREALIQRGLSL